jgi:adenylate kinase
LVPPGAVITCRALLNRLVSRGRADDTEEFICNRMKVYRDETEPAGYHRNDLRTVDALGALVEVYARALHALDG